MNPIDRCERGFSHYATAGVSMKDFQFLSEKNAARRRHAVCRRTFTAMRGSRDYATCDLTVVAQQRHQEERMDFEAAMKNPGATFGTPEVLEVTRDLSAEQKRAILMQWKDQLQQLQTADDENMAGPEPEANHGGIAELLKRVTTVLARLNLQQAG
jgi:hypothetical protein